MRSALRLVPRLRRGDGAVLTEYPTLAHRLTGVLADARRAQDVEAEVLTLDVLARLHAGQGRTGDARSLLDAADQAMAAAGHLVTANDRTDRHRALLRSGERRRAG